MDDGSGAKVGSDVTALLPPLPPPASLAPPVGPPPLPALLAHHLEVRVAEG